LSTRNATTVNFDYQARAAEFAVEDWVTPIGADSTDVGRVVNVWPGIGVVDVEWATGNRRMNVEDIVRIDRDDTVHPPEATENIPGGAPVRPGRAAGQAPDPRRVAEAFTKSAIYWANVDRGYKATRGESSGKSYRCPKPCCRGNEESVLRRSPYKREDGKTVKLLSCPNCSFLIRVNDVHGHHLKPVDPVTEGVL
jgi:hypothetical protein